MSRFHQLLQQYVGCAASRVSVGYCLGGLVYLPLSRGGLVQPATANLTPASCCAGCAPSSGEVTRTPPFYTRSICFGSWYATLLRVFSASPLLVFDHFRPSSAKTLQHVFPQLCQVKLMCTKFTPPLYRNTSPGLIYNGSERGAGRFPTNHGSESFRMRFMTFTCTLQPYTAWVVTTYTREQNQPWPPAEARRRPRLRWCPPRDHKAVAPITMPPTGLQINRGESAKFIFKREFHTHTHIDAIFIFCWCLRCTLRSYTRLSFCFSNVPGPERVAVKISSLWINNSKYTCPCCGALTITTVPKRATVVQPEGM